jgi:hypothetical protein
MFLHGPNSIVQVRVALLNEELDVASAVPGLLTASPNTHIAGEPGKVS